MEKSPTNLYFNNVISMGVSYSWTRQNDSAGFLQCDGLNHGENNFVKRSKSLNLDVLNLDLNNAGGSSSSTEEEEVAEVEEPPKVNKAAIAAKKAAADKKRAALLAKKKAAK